MGYLEVFSEANILSQHLKPIPENNKGNIGEVHRRLTMGEAALPLHEGSAPHNTK